MHLTEVQTKLMQFIKSFITEHEFPPTCAESAKGMGYKSANAAVEGLRILERKGQLSVVKGVARGIRLGAQWKSL